MLLRFRKFPSTSHWFVAQIADFALIFSLSYNVMRHKLLLSLNTWEKVMTEIMEQEQIIDGSKAVVLVILMNCSMSEVLVTTSLLLVIHIRSPIWLLLLFYLRH